MVWGSFEISREDSGRKGFIMAIATIESNHISYIEFRLSNKPEYLFKIDRDDFNKHIRGTSHWYVHREKRAKVDRPYIRRTDNSNNGKNYHLHREILGLGDYHIDCVVDHINRDTRDNRKKNLMVVTHRKNIANCDAREK